MASRTVTLPVRPGAPWTDFAWDPKLPSDCLDYTVDCADWLEAAGANLTGVEVAVTSGLTISKIDFGLVDGARSSVIVRVAGGVALTVAQVAIALSLDNGRATTALIALPIRDAVVTGLIPAVPTDNDLSVGGATITIAGQVINIPGPATTAAVSQGSLSVNGQVLTVAGTEILIGPIQT